MRNAILLLPALLFSTCLFAQRKGVDTLAGYIVRANDTIRGRVILRYVMVKKQKEFHKQYEDEEWYQQVILLDKSGAERMYIPAEISAYGWNWNDTSKATFRSFEVVVPRTGASLMKGYRKPFLKLEIEGPISLYLYYHRENARTADAFYSDRFLVNEKRETQPLKIKALLGIGFAYNLTGLREWFEGYPELSKFDMKSMVPLEVWLLVSSYNKWKQLSKQ